MRPAYVLALTAVLAGVPAQRFGPALMAATIAPAEDVVPVTPDNFARAESTLYFGAIVKEAGLGRLHHNRTPEPVTRQTVIRMNRDTLYSSAVLDLDAGPATVTIPEANGRFVSLQIINADHYTPAVHYGAGRYTLTKEAVGTRYVVAAIRTLVNAEDPQDLRAVHALQDQMQIAQPGGPGRFEMPSYDPASHKKVRDALLVLASTLPDTSRMFGRREDVDPVRFLVGAAMGWGGNPERDALYLNRFPRRNDGRTVHRLQVGEVPVDGFWSISVYNAKGYFEPNSRNLYSVNSLTARRGQDGRAVIQFGRCDDPAVINCLPITEGWNYMVRLYRPRDEVLAGRWTFPEAAPVD